jgi:hypothetical protein
MRLQKHFITHILTPEYKVLKTVARVTTINSRGTGYLNTDRGHFLVRKYVNSIK